MRNFRKAALAGATAVAVAFGSASIATAQTPETETKQVSTSSKIGDTVEKDKTADGQAIFGSSKKNETTGETFEQQPVWAKIFYGTTIFTSVAALVGLVLGPVYNFFVHGLPAGK